MAKIVRKKQLIFAEDAGAVGVSEFGTIADGAVAYSYDPDDIQTDAFLEGWLGAVLAGTKRLPAYEDMNAVMYVLSYNLAYLLQEGIAEWNTDTVYYQYSIVKKTGTYELYGSKTNDNTGNALPSQADNTDWQYLGNLADIQDIPNLESTIFTDITNSPNPYVMLASDEFINANATSGAFAITPLAAASYSGKTVKIKKTDSTFNIITITGVTTLNTQNEVVTLISNGTSWIVENRYIPSVWTAYTPTITHDSGGITNATSSGMWRRVGDSLEIRGLILFSNSSSAFQAIYAQLPSTLAIDSTKILNTATVAPFGTCGMYNEGTAIYGGFSTFASSTTIQVNYQSVGGSTVSSAKISNTAPFTFNASDAITWQAQMPINGWNG